MKKSNLKYFFIATIAALGITAVSVYSCEKQDFVPNTTEAVSNDPTKFVTEPGDICGDMIQKMIVRSDDRAVGKALIYNDTKYFYVIMSPMKGYLLGNSYMHIGSTIREIPSDGLGSPILANYEYLIDARPASTLRKFRIPIKELTGNNFVSVAVEVEKNTTTTEKPLIVWIEGRWMGEDKQGRSFVYTKQICKTDAAESNDAVE